MNDIIIRPTEKKDFEELIEIDKLIWNDENTPYVSIAKNTEEYGMHHPAGSQFVAIKEGRLAGFLGYRNPFPIPSNGHVLEIDMGVHPDFNRKGIGSALIKFIENWAEEKEFTKLSLRVLSTNPGAIAFYKANGFMEQGRLIEEFIINGKPVDDLLLYKKI